MRKPGKQLIAALLALVVLLGPAAATFGYTKPVTYNQDGDGQIIFKNFYNYSPHAWIIGKAIELLRRDGYKQEADQAEAHLLPMLEGVTFNDVWGDADLAGGSVLDYYCPTSAGTNFGFGSALFAYKNPTSSFKTHPFYGYENAAEHAQFRYDYAVRIANGQWGTDRRDLMAGWVVDRSFISGGGQEDPQNGRWAEGAGQINGQTRFGGGHPPAYVLEDLFLNHTNSQVVFPDQANDDLSTIFVPKKEVFDQAPEWLDEHFNDADDIEIYSGYDGQGYAVYANWTLDAGGSGPNCSGCLLQFDPGAPGNCNAAPMVVRLLVGSRAHAFFQLGWAIHLLEDATTPVHTINSSFTTYQVHNDIEKMADRVLVNPIAYNGRVVKNALPASTLSDFQQLYPFLPPSCTNEARDFDAADLFKSRWYADALSMQLGEGIAHAYVRDSAERTNLVMPYINCINTEDDGNWNSMGFFTAYGLDLGIKTTAGLIHRFMSDSGLSDTTPPTVSILSQPSSPTNQNVLNFSGSASDLGSNLESIEYSLDDGQNWSAVSAGDGTFDELTEDYSFTTPALPDGTYAIRVRATDVSNNVTPPASQPRAVIVVDTTPPAISIQQPSAGQYSHSATLTLDYSVTDLLSGVKTYLTTLDGSTALGGHGLASGQAINLLTELSLGDHMLKIVASDNAGNNALQLVPFSIVVTADGIKDDVSQFLALSMIKNQGEANSLSAKLDAAAAARARGDCQTAANNYQSFINELRAQSGKGIDPGAAQTMIADAQYLIAHCP